MEFLDRHIGPRQNEIENMLAVFGCLTLDEFSKKVLPQSIQLQQQFEIEGFDQALNEHQAVEYAKELARGNTIRRSFLGMGYHDCIVPAVIQRNVLENPAWYTQYTPYQPEISQGRLEALLNFQTLFSELTGLPISNASLLDEATAAAEAMSVSYASVAKKRRQKLADGQRLKYVVDSTCHPQTIALLETRAQGLDIEIELVDVHAASLDEAAFGILIQYPNTFGQIANPKTIIEAAQAQGAVVSFACDPLALLLLTPPADLGADIAFGSAQRFGVPMGYGGPHAAFFCVKDSFRRLMPGRLVGVSKDSSGNPALRLALQTREQHIRREKATSNICTAQVLLAIMASMYAVYHGPRGLRAIATRVHDYTRRLARSLSAAGLTTEFEQYFDTLSFQVEAQQAQEIRQRADRRKVELRFDQDTRVVLSLNETNSLEDLELLFEVLTGKPAEEQTFSDTAIDKKADKAFRKADYLQQEVFHSYHSETEFLRYMKKLEERDLSLAFSMIPLGSCTMKLNATSEMLPVTWPEFAKLHPFTSLENSSGYQVLFEELETALRGITGFDAVSLQPNSGAQGEFAGLLAIRRYFDAQNQSQRKICIIPTSAHGTNPASAIMSGLEVQIVECDQHGNVDLDDLREKAEAAGERLAALMVTYPSTHGVFEEQIHEICSVVHQHGGQVYMDGANLNALVGLSRPAEYGVDVCHINLHKTFCIPHGGGGPGMGPIAAKAHLKNFLPGHSVIEPSKGLRDGAVSAAPWGSSSILPISWMYMKMMGAQGMRRATQIAILNANYIASRLEEHFPVLYRGSDGFVAHECIIDTRPLKKSAGIEVEDIAKRLIDYGFHAPTMSWPVAGTLMIEPTESESQQELDRFCEAMISIRKEIALIEDGTWSAEHNPLKQAPHTAAVLAQEDWSRSYSREQAIFPAEWTKARKFFPAVGRVDSSYGDRNLVCTCPDIESFRQDNQENGSAREAKSPSVPSTTAAVESSAAHRVN